jgi:hypothetical protein
MFGYMLRGPDRSGIAAAALDRNAVHLLTVQAVQGYNL